MIAELRLKWTVGNTGNVFSVVSTFTTFSTVFSSCLTTGFCSSFTTGRVVSFTESITGDTERVQPRGLPANCTCSCNKLPHRQSYYWRSKPPRISIANRCACSHDSARQGLLPAPSSRHYPAWKRCQNACHLLSCITWARTFTGKTPGLTTRSNDVILSSRKNCSR